MASATYQHHEHRVHLIMYHLIFCPKRRKKVLVGDVAHDLDALIREKCAEQKWIVHELAIMPDHVHLFVQVNPDDSASETTRQIKGYTSRVLRQRFPELLKLPSLWTTRTAETTVALDKKFLRRLCGQCVQRNHSAVQKCLHRRAEGNVAMLSLVCYRMRLYPSKTQGKDLAATLDVCRSFYNGLLDERKVGYDNGHSVTKTEQLRRVKELKAFGLPLYVHSHVLQGVAADLDKAFQNFFRRVKSGETPGYPRYKGRDQFDSFGLKELGNGFKIDRRRLEISGIGRIVVRWHREIVGTIKTVRLTRKANKWYACFACEVETDGETEALPPTGKAVGIDVGISHLLATSDGEFVENPRWYRAAQKDLRRVQRSIARKKKGGRNRRKTVLQLQRHHERVKNRRQDFLNKVAHGLISRYDALALEDLRIKNMVRNRHLSKSILDAGWNYLTQRLRAKAGSAERVVEFVPAAYTSKTCSACGTIFETLTLSDRWVSCACGLSLDRDHNAAKNILCRSRLGNSLWASTQGSGLSVAQEAIAL